MSSTVPIWKLTRTTTARRLYEALTAVGLKVSVLDLFSRGVSDVPVETSGLPESPRKDHPVSSSKPTLLWHGPPDWTVDDAGLESDHRVIGAIAQGDLVGVTLLSLDGPVYIEPLVRTVAFDGGYLWGVEVDPAVAAD